MQLELSGNFYTLYFEGRRDEQVYGSGFGTGFRTGRFLFSGQANINRERGEVLNERFLFLTEESADNQLDALTLLTPTGFDDHAGWTRTEMIEGIKRGPPSKLVDAYAAMLLEALAAWRLEELARRQHVAHRVLIPTLTLRPPTRQVIELGFGSKIPVESWD